MRIVVSIAILFCALPCRAQVGSGVYPPISVAISSGTTLPATCSPGALYFKTNATPGQNLYGCTSANSWSLLGGSGGGDVYSVNPNVFTRGQTVNGGSDEVQLTVRGASGQSSALFEVKKYDGTVVLQAAADGTVSLGSGSGASEFTNVSAPSTPSSGITAVWADATNKGWWAKDDAGTASRTAVVTSATSGQFFTAFNSDGTFTKGSPTVTYSPGATFYNGGNNLTAGQTWYFTAPYACTISAWNIVVDAGTATIDVWKIASGTAKPTVSNTITASAKPAISSGTAVHSTTLTGWTTAVTKNDIFAFYLDTVSGVKNLDFTLECNQ